MRSFITFALAMGLGLAFIAPARPQDNKEDVSFKTIDGVLIKGVFYTGSKGANSPTVIMLHKWGGNSSQNGWTELAKRLQEKGYSVLTFDFRGHGQSTTVDPEKFWKYQPNVNHYAKSWKKDQTSIKYSDFKPNYLPYLLNDIMAAREDLDNRNDSAGCNVSNILVIGAEEGASLGLAWMTTEFFRESINKKNDNAQAPPLLWWTNPNTKFSLDRPASEDLAGAIFLSAPRNPLKLNYPYSHFESLTKEKLRTIPMWFTYGEDDKLGKSDAGYFADVFKLNKGDLKIKNLTLPIPKTTLRGAQLLAQPALQTATEDLIEKFLENMVKIRPNEAKKIRNANEYQKVAAPIIGLGFSP
jgi:hypothetical protein